MVISDNMLKDFRALVDNAVADGGSIRSIAGRAGRSHTTLSRILSKEVTNSQLETIRSFVDVLTTDSEQNNFLRAHFPLEYGEYDHKIKKHKDKKAVNFFLTDIFSFQVYLLAEKGFSREEVVSKVSILSLKYVEEGLKNNWLCEKNAVISRNGPELKYSAEECVRAIYLASKYVKIAGLTSPYHLTYKQLVANKCMAKKIQDALTHVYNLVEELEQTNETVESGVPIFVGMIMGTLSNIRFEENKH